MVSGTRSLRSRLPPGVRVCLRALRRWPRPRWGSLRRNVPFSANYGFERGTPVDRVYIVDFLHQHGGSIAGRVLEVKDTDFTGMGGDRVTSSDVLDIDADNPRATVVADLGEQGSLGVERFDCIVLTQVLQLVPDTGTALRNLYDALAPGGTLLITVPCVSVVVAEINDIWRWTPAGFAVELGRHLPPDACRVSGAGTLMSSVAFLYGLAAEELRGRDLAPPDPAYPLLVGAVVRKPAAPTTGR